MMRCPIPHPGGAQDDELQLMKLRNNLDSTTNEKDLIGTQMIRRNDEIGLLNEKINIITMALDRGNTF